MLDFIRVACAVPPVRVADTDRNAEEICAYMPRAQERKVDLVVFPRLCLTGSSCADLFAMDTLLDGAYRALATVTQASENYPELTVVVSLPVRLAGKLYDCAAVVRDGIVWGLVPRAEVHAADSRWFAPGKNMPEVYLTAGMLGLPGDMDYAIPVSSEQVFRLGNEVTFGIAEGDDLLSPCPQVASLSLKGAELIVHPAACGALAGSGAKQLELVRHWSAVCSCVYAYVGAGCGESTSDMVYSGQSVLAENGHILATQQEIMTDSLVVCDCDLGRIRAERRKNAHRFAFGEPAVEVFIDAPALRSDGSEYPVHKLPFVPDTATERAQRCREIFNIQVEGLRRRLEILGSKPVLGISGGLDSTLALLVATEAMARLGRSAADVHGITMPCFGTSGRTYNNSWALMNALGITGKEISIREAVTLHFQDIGHNPQIHDGTYENSQARERTQILMDYASVVGGLVVGTGDLSELALGWCTYNGDHMSMYSVNGGVPKTLIRWIIETVAQEPRFAPAKAVLEDILDTPISPELLPPDAQGKISQQTEDLVGPYALHDFFLYHMVRFGFGPKKIYTLACRAFANDFDGATVKKWLATFCRRFFTQQFKRNCQPDGVKVGSVGFGPRGDWQMPGDATARIWLQELENL